MKIMEANTIKEFINKDKVYSVYRNDNNPYCHFTGYTQIVDDEMLIYHISPYGEYDGFALIKTEDIIRLDCDSEYEECIEKLFQKANQKHHSFDVDNDSALFFMLCNYAQENICIVTLENYGASISGFIEKYTDNEIWIDVVNEYGKRDGKTVIRIDEISAVFVDTQYEMKLKTLSNIDKGKYWG